MWKTLDRWDRAAFLFLNNLGSEWADALWMSFTHWGIAILIGGILYGLYKAYGWRTILILLLFYGLLILISDQACGVWIKRLSIRMRPCYDEQLLPLMRPVRVWLEGTCGGAVGFVSAHAGNSFALATLSTWLLKKRYPHFWIFAFGFALLFSYSRIYVGVHFPGDIIAGGIVGVLAGWIVIRILKIPRIKSLVFR